MKTKKIILGIAVPSLILVTIAVGAVILGLAYWGNKETVPKEAYAEYVCRDDKLHGGERGKALWGYRDGIDVIKYWKIKGVSEKDFVYVTKANYMDLGGGPYVVQSPENTTDVLRDWTIKSISLFGESNIEPEIFLTDREALDEVSEVVRESEVLIEHSTSYGGNDRVSEMMEIRFEENKYIYWRGHYEIYKFKETGEIVVTLDQGAYDKNMHYSQVPDIKLDSSCQLYSIIVDANKERIEELNYVSIDEFDYYSGEN